MRTLLLVSAITALAAGGPGFAFAAPTDPAEPSSTGCISTYCKDVLDPDDPVPEVPMPDPPICMELVADDSTPPEDQWDGCILW